MIYLLNGMGFWLEKIKEHCILEKKKIGIRAEQNLRFSFSPWSADRKSVGDLNCISKRWGECSGLKINKCYCCKVQGFKKHRITLLYLFVVLLLAGFPSDFCPGTEEIWLLLIEMFSH